MDKHNYLNVCDELLSQKDNDPNIASSIFSHSKEAIIVMDLHGTIIDANNSAQTMMGYSLDMLRNRNVSILNSTRHSSAYYRHVLNTLNKYGSWNGEIWKRCRNGQEIPVAKRTVLVRNELNQPIKIISLFQDISAQHNVEEKIKYIEQHDSLTGMMNRNMLISIAQKMILESDIRDDKTAFLFIDLDGFKKLNDSYGHITGDKVIKETAQRLSDQVGNAKVARITGDEFFVLYNYKEDYQLQMFIKKMMACFDDPFLIEGDEVFITTSIGISTYPNDGDDPNDLVQNADTAMFNVKLNGKNNFMMYDPWMTENVHNRLQIELSLRKALDKQEFVLFYQPKINLVTNKIGAVEALIRWFNKGEMIPPAMFIPIAEETGFIIKIGAWVIDEVCRQIALWDKQGHHMPKVALNISGEQFIATDIFETVKDSANKHGIDPSRLEVEVTESVIMENYDSTVVQLQKLKDIGVSIAIDDFGTGYSSLGRLYKLPVNRLKIDRTFVMDLDGTTQSQTMVDTIISMTKAMGTEVTAEGIETADQERILKELGCQEGQGFLYSKAIPADELTKLLTTFNGHTH